MMHCMFSNGRKFDNNLSAPLVYTACSSGCSVQKQRKSIFVLGHLEKVWCRVTPVVTKNVWHIDSQIFKSCDYVIVVCVVGLHVNLFIFSVPFALLF